MTRPEVALVVSITSLLMVLAVYFAWRGGWK